MKAKFFSITSPEGMTPEEGIAYAARVSSPQNQDKHDTAAKLLRYCLRNGHWSPFEMADFTIEIETSRAIMAQILRHKSFSFQEFSQRYAVAGKGHEPIEIRMKHEGGNRQGSGEVDEELSKAANEMADNNQEFYNGLIQLGAAPESARFDLTLATTTTAYMKGPIRSWITYFWQRLDGHAQKEHRDLAGLAFKIFEEHFPAIAEMVVAGRSRYVEREQIEQIIAYLGGDFAVEQGHLAGEHIKYLRSII